MKRQQSILSFLHHKPSTDKPPSNPNPPRGNPTDDVTGTDTPPEKEQRSFFAAGEAKGSGGSMFNSIKHKFMRPNTVQKPSDRNTLDGGHSSINSTSNKNNLSNGRDKESLLSGFPRMQNVIDLDETAGEGDIRHPLFVDSEGDITGPETPGTQPLVPRLKRVQEDGFNFGSATTHSSIDNTKSVRFSHDLSAEGKKDGVASEISKRVTFSLDSPAEKKKPGLSSDNSKRITFSHDLLAEGNIKQRTGCLGPFVDVIVHLRYIFTCMALPMSVSLIFTTLTVSGCVMILFSLDFVGEADVDLSAIILMPLEL